MDPKTAKAAKTAKAPKTAKHEAVAISLLILLYPPMKETRLILASKGPTHSISEPDLLRLDVGLADDAPVVVILLAKMRAELRSADIDRLHPLGREPRPRLRQLGGFGEPHCELRDHRLRRRRRRQEAVPNLHVEVPQAELADGRHVRQPFDARARADRERP